MCIRDRVKEVLTLPDSDVIPEGFQFRPKAVIKDKKGFTYVLSDGSFYGALVFSQDNTFFGFFGSNPTEPDLLSNVVRVVKNFFIDDTNVRVQKLPYPVSYTHLDVYKRQGWYNGTCPDTAPCFSSLRPRRTR